MSDTGVRVSIIGYVVAVAGLVTLALTGQLFATQPLLIAVQVLAFLLMIWARVTFGRRSFHLGANPTPGELVTSGPYRFWRHPIYAAIIFFVWAGIAVHLSPSSVLVGIAVTAALFTRMLVEERFLRAQYPGYAAHATRTCLLIPWLV